MSAQDYFKTAAAELRKAVQEKRRDMDLLKKQIVEKEQSVREYVDRLKQNQRQKEAMASSSNVDNGERANLMRAAQEDSTEANKMQQTLNNDRSIMQRAMTNLQQDITSIERTAQEFETRS